MQPRLSAMGNSIEFWAFTPWHGLYLSQCVSSSYTNRLSLGEEKQLTSSISLCDSQIIVHGYHISSIGKYLKMSTTKKKKERCGAFGMSEFLGSRVLAGRGLAVRSPNCTTHPSPDYNHISSYDFQKVQGLRKRFHWIYMNKES